MADSAPRYLICVDYGTTFTGVSWVLTQEHAPTLRDVHVVRGWNGAMGPKVPSEITYAASSQRDHERWGFDLKYRDYVLRWTKMELEPPSREQAMVSLQKTLEEARLLGGIKNALVDFIPLHLIKNAEEIVVDYLTEVARKVREDILGEVLNGLVTLSEFPIDLMITHPATWHPKAQNSSFRAAHQAFRKVFREMEDNPGKLMLATEPEACAQYTMRVAQDLGMTRFMRGECFIVVDAGGGTVDLASYRIDNLPPNFKMTKVTEVSGGLFGATRVDEHFINRFVPARLSQDDYNELLGANNGAEKHGSGAHVVFSGGQQHMLSRFQTIKESFAGPPSPGERRQDYWVDLPPGIGVRDDPQRGISQGRLRLTSEDLVEIFRESVEGTLHLITEQLVQVQLKRLDVRTVFLSGGFSRNPYLFNRINALTRRWRFDLVRGDERALTRDDNDDEGSWTAVVRGAALIGLGIGCEAPPPCRACPYHIGVAASAEFRDYYPERETPHLVYVDEFDGKPRLKDQIKWLVAKGDLITAEDGIEKTVKIVRKMTRTGNRVGSVVVVLSTDREKGHEGRYEHRVSLDYDINIIPRPDQPGIIHSITDHRTGVTYHKVIMELTVRLDQHSAHVELLCGKTTDLLGNIGAPGYRLASTAIPLPVPVRSARPPGPTHPVS